VNEFSGNPMLDEEFIIKGRWVRHSVPTLCFSLTEKPKPGKFNPEKARKAGVPEGPLWKRLQSGKSIVLKGRKISPSGLVGPMRPGKKIVYSSDTRPCRSVVNLAKAADLLIHECTFNDMMADKAKAYLHSTSVEAARTAMKAGVNKLVLTHISSMYDEEEEEKILKEAKEVFPETVLAQDLMRIEL
jgi:ribonuclease Z